MLTCLISQRLSAPQAPPPCRSSLKMSFLILINEAPQIFECLCCINPGRQRCNIGGEKKTKQTNQLGLVSYFVTSSLLMAQLVSITELVHATIRPPDLSNR